jgi:hypothetical protein
VRPFSKGKSGRRGGGYMVIEADDTTKRVVVVREAEGDS